MYEQAPQRRAITEYTKPTNNGLHLFLGLVTAGMWTVCVHLPLLVIRAIKKQKQVTYYR